MATRFWGSPEAALGERVRPAGTSIDGTPLPWHRIVGVVGDLRNAGLREASKPTLWFPMTRDAGRQLRTQYVVLRRPDEEFRAKAAFTYDEFETMRGQGAVSGPLSCRRTTSRILRTCPMRSVRW